MSKVMSTWIGTVTYVSIRFVEQEKANKRVIVDIEQNTKHTYEYGDKCVWIWKRREIRVHVYGGRDRAIVWPILGSFRGPRLVKGAWQRGQNGQTVLHMACVYTWASSLHGEPVDTSCMHSRRNMGRMMQFRGWFSNTFLNVESPTAPIEGSRTSQQTRVRRCVETERLILCWGRFCSTTFHV